MNNQAPNPALKIKEVQTEHPVIELIRKRWSARSFAETMLEQTQLDTLFEAASWAASSGNEQPWQYVYAFRGTEGFEKLWDCLDKGNQIWTKRASVLMASVKRTIIEKSQKENHWSSHDTGMANAHLFLQAISMDIYPHPMAGFDKDKLTSLLGLTEHQEPVCMIALGYLDSPEKLEEPFRTRELTPRTRKPIESFTTKL
jgi:nitroreductase